MIPPELVYSCSAVPFDVNNVVPGSTLYPKTKLCAWTAVWRDMLLSGKMKLDKLVVVAGGDCHNALVDGQKASKYGQIDTHYFFYPFDGNTEEMERQLEKLAEFLGGVKEPEKMAGVMKAKELALKVDRLRVEGKVKPSDAFPLLISASDFGGDLGDYTANLELLIGEAERGSQPSNSEGLSNNSSGEDTPSGIPPTFKRVAVIGVPPIYCDFHLTCEELGLWVAYDELPYEFLRLGGENLDQLASSYADYSFARPLEFRLEIIKAELEKRNVEGIIHYTQYACHHILEDDMFRHELDLPILTIQGDLPRKADEQLKLRLEAFYESL